MASKGNDKHSLVAIGEALIDFIPDRRDCAFADVGAFAPMIGGAPANVCAAFARLGGKARLLTQLGDDPFGHKILRALSDVGVDTDSVCLTKDANTALAFVSIASDGNRTFSFYRKPSADMLYAPDAVRQADFDDAYALHFCSVSLGDFPMKSAHKAAIAIQRGKGGIVSFDPNLRFPLWEDREALRQTVREFLPLADVVKISDEELDFITGEQEIEKALPILFCGHVRLVLYTCGANGAYAFTRTQRAFSPSHAVDALDTTGAGDCFIGAFLWMLQRYGVTRETLGDMGEVTMRTCLDFANAACAYSVVRHGAIASYPDLPAVQTILKGKK